MNNFLSQPEVSEQPEKGESSSKKDKFQIIHKVRKKGKHIPKKGLYLGRNRNVK